MQRDVCLDSAHPTSAPDMETVACCGLLCACCVTCVLDAAFALVGIWTSTCTPCVPCGLLISSILVMQCLSVAIVHAVDMIAASHLPSHVKMVYSDTG